MPDFILRPHQQKIVDTAPDKYGLFLKMRVGKTATAIRLAATRCTSCIVIVPKSLKEQWEEEVHNWNNSKCIFYVITKETFRKHWKEIPKFQAVIIDECHIGFANFKSQLYKSAEAFSKKHQLSYIWLLTGTPYTSSSWSIYSLGRLLGKNWKWFDWKSHFFYEVAMGPRTIPVQKKGIEKEISTIINRIGVTMSLSDISDQADDEYVKEYFDLNKEQKDNIKNAFDPLPIVRFTKYHQIEQGTLKGDGYVEDRQFNCSKNQRLLEIISENKKVAVICRYNLQIDFYRRRVESGLEPNRKIFIINGETKDKNSIIKEIESCEDCVVLINSMCSAGYSLASIDTMIFASMDFSFVNYTQMINRIKNMDKNKSCTYIHLLTRDTKDYKSVDNAVYNAVSNKQDFDVCIFEKNAPSH